MYSLIDLSMYFIFYSIIGWSVEVIYATVNKGIFVNRGFLNGPLCPIYGAGATLVIIGLTPLENNLALLFAGSVILTSLIEFLTGLILELIFNQKWWDYTNEPFNIKGYICVKFSIMWGLACVFVMKIIQPMVNSFIGHTPHAMCIIIITVFYSLFGLDIVVTVVALAKMHIHIRIINEVDKMLRAVSNSMGAKISEQTLENMEYMSNQKSKIDNAIEKLEAKAKERFGENYDNIKKPGYVLKRLEKAFPNLDFSRLGEIKKRIEELKNSRNNKED